MIIGNSKKIIKKEKSSDTNKELKNLITDLNLQSHPEGGMYARIFQSSIEVTSTEKKRYDGESRAAGTSIYYLLHSHDFSAWHNLKSDEIWHFYKGCPVKIHIISPLGEYRYHLLGDPTIFTGAFFQVVITAGNWFAAEVINKNSYSLVGCTVSPGFEFRDFKLADRKFLTSLFPQHANIINEFTRDR
ncbi:MAG: cupin domain-containing protein [Gammaproteobacteria bacterium]